MRVLIIDDDEELCALLAEFFSREGIESDSQNDGTSGLAAAAAGGFDLAVLDVMLPGLDGFEVLRRLRAESSLPVVMLTARADDEDRIAGLESGADDYLAKPFNPRELLARIRAVTRRASPDASQSGCFEAGDLRIDLARRQASLAGSPIRLTTAEFEVLALLMSRTGNIVNRDELSERLYGRESTAFDRSIDMHISHLRRKIGSGCIKTVHGSGYQFAGPAEERTA